MDRINNYRRDENIDPATGQPLFKPQTGRSPHGRAYFVDTQKIGEHLYGYHK
jgi:hypothetical protein